jgi:hypothetical protein
MRTHVQIILFFLLILPLSISAQELFPTTESASCIPKGAIGIRPIVETYKEYAVHRYQFAMRLMYGITSRWEIYLEPVINNHHSLYLPENFLTHTHPTPSTTSYSAQSIFGVPYPFLFGGFYFYTKYRLLNFDEDDGHWRLAVYGEYSTSKRAHDEAEPDLQGDNGGYGAGFILTRLKGKLAVSFTGAYVVANSYSENVNYPYYGHAIFSNSIQYGMERNYDLSVGYSLFPSHYENYYQDNYNVYLELIGSSYGGAVVNVDGVQAIPSAPSLKAGNYFEAWPGIQGIFNSNTRIDFSTGFELYNRSWNHFYPVYVLTCQHYIYVSKKKKVDDANPKRPSFLF